MTYAPAPSSATPSSKWDSAGLITAMNNLSLQVLGDWIMDSGATSHMTSDDGILSNPTSLSSSSQVTVDNGSTIPISHMGNVNLSTSSVPFKLTNILVVSSLIKSLISVCKFTNNDSCSIEFNLLGFSIKDLHTKTVILRYNSQGDLYTIFPTVPTTSPTAFPLADSFATTWHRRLVNTFPFHSL